MKKCRFGEFLLEPEYNNISKDGESTALSPRVMDVLAYLVDNHDRVVPADELLDKFWEGRVVEESTIHRHINQIRTALGDSARNPQYIKTISKRGYQAIAPVVLLDTEGQPEATTQALPPAARIFVSYAHKDAEVVVPEIMRLKQSGLEIWYDDGISAGDNWRNTIGESLLQSSHVVFFVSEHSLNSEHCRREIHLAADEGIPIVPVRLTDAVLPPDLKLGLSGIQILDFNSPGYEQRLTEALSTTATQPAFSPAPTPMRPSRSRKAAAATAGVALIVLAAALFFWLPSEPALTPEDLESIAVLPFVDLSDGNSAQGFAKGLSDLVLDGFAQIGHMRVASRTTTFQLAEAGADIASIAEQLEVHYVLEGSVQQFGDALRITAQLIRVADNFHVWSKTYEGQVANRMQLQENTSKSIVFRTHSKMMYDVYRQYPDLFEEYRGVKPEAVAFYLQSEEEYSSYVAGEGGDVGKAMRLMERAAAEDPDFEQAQLELAWNYTYRIDPNLSLEQSRASAHAAIEKVRTKAPESQDVLFFLAQIYFQLDLDYARAEQTILRGMELYPDGDWWKGFLASIAGREGRMKDARRFLTEELSNFDNASGERPTILLTMSRILIAQGAYRRALGIIEDGLALVGDGAPRATFLLYKSQALRGLGREQEAADLLEEAWHAGGFEVPAEFAPVFASYGEKERAMRALNDAVERRTNRIWFASTHIRLGDLDEAFRILKDAVEDHDPSVLESWHSSADLDVIRTDPRFIALEQELESRVTHTQAYLNSKAGLTE